MNKKTQSGFVHLIIIIVLAVALIGALGFVYWQNFMQPKVSDTTDTTITADTAVLLDKSITENATGSNLTLNYPSSWIVADSTSLNPDPSSSNERIYITSPDTNVKISFWVGIDGVGGTCNSADAGTFSDVNTYTLPNYSGYTLYETIVAGFRATSKVLKNNSEIQVGNSVCELGLGLFFTAKDKTTDQLSISFENGLSPNSTDSINSARATDNYKTAVKIVQSLHEQ